MLDKNCLHCGGSLQLSSLSKQRDALMGFSILWIMFFHSYVQVPMQGGWLPLALFKQAGYGGVELFFLLSGMGLAYGWAKRALPYDEFIQKRVVRILPAFWVGASLFHVLVKHKGIRGTVAAAKADLATGHLGHGAMTLGFAAACLLGYCLLPLVCTWLLARGRRVAGAVAALAWAACLVLYFGNRHGGGTWNVLRTFLAASWSYWFLPTILGFYALFPLAVDFLFERSKKEIKGMRAIGLLALTSALAIGLSWQAGPLLLVWIRIPLFLAGILVGLHLGCGKDLDFRWRSQLPLLLVGCASLVWLLLGLDGKTLWKHGLWWYPFWPMVLALPLILAWVFEMLTEHKALAQLIVVLNWAGKRSLELYLVHYLVFRLGAVASDGTGISVAAWNWARVPEFTFFLLISCIGAEVLAKVCGMLFPKFVRT